MDVPKDGLVSRYVNRRVSRPMSRWLAKTPATPNQVSVASFVIALGSLGLFASDHSIWAGLAVQASSIVDGVDGDLARLKGMATRFGGFFDAVLDRYADVAILGGLAYWSFEFEDRVPAELLAVVSLLAIAGTFMVSYTRARAEASLGGGFPGLAGSLASRDARLLLITVGAVLGQALVTLILLAGFTNAVVVWRVAQARGRS
ncbi:MAG: CDP-alcohol phosphatidyltransferase family protein [Chloroflexi bacterium]|nr:CDP-alcohol phosphatidyltransferase family protein [Chloroflexota bacterium]